MTSWTEAPPPAGGDQIELAAIVEALAGSYGVVTGPKRLVRRTRLDTFDRRLRAAGLTLEHQIAAGGERLALGRLDGTSTVVVSVTQLRWPAMADVLPEGPVRDTVAPLTGIRALMVVSDERRRVRRLELHNKDGKTVARVELDEPDAGSAGSKAPAGSTGPAGSAEPAGSTGSAGSTQLTVRPLRGYDEQARRARALLAGFGLREVGHAGDRAPYSAPTLSTVDRDAPACALLREALTAFLATMRANVPGLLDDVDSEFLHDFRVAIRRTRATLKLGRPALPEVIRSRWEGEFKWLGDMTTPVRDLDVYELDLPTMGSWLVSADPADLEPFATHLRGRRTAERRALVRALRSTRFRRLVTEWGQELDRLARNPDDAARDHADLEHDGLEHDGLEHADLEHAGLVDLSAGELADRAISRAYRRVARQGGAIGGDSPAGDLHALRKRCKELRYALEVFAPVIDDDSRKRAVNDLKGLQDVLGRFQDSEVQRQGLRSFAEEMMVDGTPAGALLAMGELIGHLDAEQDRAREAFDVEFTRFVRPSSQRLMHRLGGGR